MNSYPGFLTTASQTVFLQVTYSKRSSRGRSWEETHFSQSCSLYPPFSPQVCDCCSLGREHFQLSSLPRSRGCLCGRSSTCTVRRQNEQSTGGGTAQQSSWTDSAGQTKSLPSFFFSFPKFLKSLRTKMKHPTKHSSLKGSPDQLVIFTWKEVNFILNSLVRRKVQFCCRETFQRSFDLYVETYIRILNFELIFFKIYSKENTLIYTYVSRLTTHFSAHAYEMAWWQLKHP